MILPFALFCEKINISAGYLQRQMIQGNEKTILKGYTQNQAEITLEGKVIKGNIIEIYGQDSRYIKGNGSVVIIDEKEETKITGDNFFYDRQLEYLELTGSITMEDNKNETVIKCKKVENFGKKNIAHFQSSIRIFKKDSTARSEFAIYDRGSKNLELFGFPVVYKEGDEYRSTKITINTENENIILQGEVRGQITQKENENN